VGGCGELETWNVELPKHRPRPAPRLLINRDTFGFDELGFDALKELVG
jgi:hypothetical protein